METKDNGKLKLNERQEKFCLEIFSGKSATKAAKDAGYSSKTAYSIGHENLKKPEIQARIQELNKEATDAAVMDVIERKHRLSEMGRGKVTDHLAEEGGVEVDREKAGNIAELKRSEWRGGKDGRAEEKTTTVKLHNPLTAIAELNKMEGTYEPEKHHLTSEPIIVKVIKIEDV